MPAISALFPQLPYKAHSQPLLQTEPWREEGKSNFAEWKPLRVTNKGVPCQGAGSGSDQGTCCSTFGDRLYSGFPSNILQLIWIFESIHVSLYSIFQVKSFYLGFLSSPPHYKWAEERVRPNNLHISLEVVRLLEATSITDGPCRRSWILSWITNWLRRGWVCSVWGKVVHRSSLAREEGCGC